MGCMDELFPTRCMGYEQVAVLLAVNIIYSIKC